MAALHLSPASGQIDVRTDLPVVPWDRVESFVGQITHDIRNGLNALELQLTFLGEISTDAEARDEVKRLRGTVNTITRQLQALRLATGTTTAYPLEYPAADFFDDLHARFAKLHPKDGGQVIWEIAPTPGSLLSVDPEQTLSALLELVSNALHFAQTETRPVQAQVFTSGSHTVFRLQEPQSNPPAITPEEWGRTPLLTTRRGAYGLGLFQTRRSLEGQACTLEVAYATEEKLFVTTVTLPGVPAKQP